MQSLTMYQFRSHSQLITLTSICSFERRKTPPLKWLTESSGRPWLSFPPIHPQPRIWQDVRPCLGSVITSRLVMPTAVEAAPIIGS
jgi:hypothetical protein